LFTSLFGCVADDFTGATDMGALLARRGLRVALMSGVPSNNSAPANVDAIIIALKSRTIPVDEAVQQSLAAARWLKNVGAKTLYFKYCSTFDSTDQGNIGPVAKALGDELKVEHILFNPAFPENGRSVYQGYLFVGDRLISESGMAHHPLTPMRDPDLVRVLGRQLPGDQIGLLASADLRAGVRAITDKIVSGPRYLICDSVSDDDLFIAAQGAKDCDFATGGSAFGAAFAAARHPVNASKKDSSFPRPVRGSKGVILAGSCSVATLRQIAAVPNDILHLRINAESLAQSADALKSVTDQALAELTKGAVLISSSLPPEELAAVQQDIGREQAGAMIETAFADIAQILFEAGQRIFIVAGGETSGAVAERLGAHQYLIGPEIAPGVPWCYSDIGGGTWFALKSGNFGGDDFFADAQKLLLGEMP
jgi:3-dehydrotetronate 4-kinase